MIQAYSFSRAAILCFGGWGLQVMFHLLPRLQAAQEQRTALGMANAEMSKLTSFGAVLAEPLLDANQQAQFYVRQPRLDQPLPPFYIEKLLGRLGRDVVRAFDEQTAGMLTNAEKQATLLLGAAEPMLKPLDFAGRSFFAPASGLAPAARPATRTDGVRRATRVDLFRTALTHAEPMARLLETNLLDPIRQDDLVEDDPFVQSTLYVIAPMFEPLASALIWPLVAHLRERIGYRHVSQVVALFATGSYASDLTRPVEDASAYAALAELELLTGVRRGEQEASALAAMQRIVDAQAPELGELVGRPLFDYIYLLDREKSNQGLAQDSQELAVVAANALEALTVAGGNFFVQEQLGVGLYTGDQRPYSILGAAGDYVPLTQILQTVNRQEESRLVREWVLRNSDDANPTTTLGAPPDAATANGPLVDLDSLGVTPAQVLPNLATHLADVLGSRAPTSVEELRVTNTFILPKPAALQLRRVPAAEWGKAFQMHLQSLEEYLKLAVGPAFLDETWGTQAVEIGREWFLYEVDDRLLPATVSRMQKRLLEILAASPTGLTQAQVQTQRWLHEIEQARQKLYTRAEGAFSPNGRQLARVQRQLTLHNWQMNYGQTIASTPALASIVVRAGGALGVVTLLALIYLLVVGRSWGAGDSQTLFGFATGIFIATLVTYRIMQNRIRKLRRDRVAQAQATLTAHLQEAVSDGFVRAYQRLAELLNHWTRMLADAAGELATLSTSPSLPSIPPPGVPFNTLYQPHVSQPLWERCLEYLRTQQDGGGQRSEERLGRMWGVTSWHSEMKRILSSNAPPNGQSQARTIAQLMRDTVRQSVAPVNIEQPYTETRLTLIRSLAKEFSIEHLLWRSAAEDQDLQRRLRMLELGSRTGGALISKESAANRRYVEHAWRRAKPAGNYDVADRLAVHSLPIEFVAASGDPDSGLTRTLLDELNLTLLPTGDPFSILFVRTVHGLGLDDLECMQRYRAELAYLSTDERLLVQLLAPDFAGFYQPTRGSNGKAEGASKPDEKLRFEPIPRQTKSLLQQR